MVTKLFFLAQCATSTNSSDTSIVIDSFFFGGAELSTETSAIELDDRATLESMQSLVDQPIESDEDNNEEILPEDEQPMPSSAVTRYDIGTLTAKHLIPGEVEVAVKF